MTEDLALALIALGVICFVFAIVGAAAEITNWIAKKLGY